MIRNRMTSRGRRVDVRSHRADRTSRCESRSAKERRPGHRQYGADSMKAESKGSLGCPAPRPKFALLESVRLDDGRSPKFALLLPKQV
jgi:hypothetical protein